MRVVFTVAALLLMLAGCAALHPHPQTMTERLAALPKSGLPLEKPVTIRWNQYQVPFIEAQTDRDLAFALGLVHAHLRLGQIRVLKQVVQGRLSESMGPGGQDADYSLRIVDIGRAAPEMVKKLKPEARAMLDSFVAGLNYYQAHMKVLPPEFALLGLDPEPFTAADLIAIGRLGSIDVNWSVYLDLLPLRNRPDWKRIWARAIVSGAGPVPSFHETSGNLSLLETITLGTARWGSNALVVAPKKSATGHALIAGDPHLGLGIPNIWLLAGIRSPHFTGVGLMIPGLPLIAEGRSMDLAWAGTNMRAANSDLYDLSAVKDPSIQSRETLIKTRWWFDITRRLRTSRFGSIISDAPLLNTQPGETIALRWIGYQATDEVGDLLHVMQATNATEFHKSLGGFAVSPQNFLCADTSGNICHALATVVPKRLEAEPKSVILDPSDPENDWHEFADAETLPFALNPPEGFLVSANNRPADTPYPISYFYSADERVRRMQQLLAAPDKVTIADLKKLQRDTLSLNSQEIAIGLVRLIDSVPEAKNADPKYFADLKAFDGDYRVDAHGPVAFETLLYHLVPATYGASSPADLPDPYSDLRQLRSFLVDDIKDLPPDKKRDLLVSAIKAAASDSRKFKTWGDMHRLRIQHWFANLPLVGHYFVYGDYPTGGSRETVMKTAHGLTNSVEPATYGSQARFISDMGDPDSAEFALVGGNDGWLGSANLLDQVPLWRSGQYIKMPLRPAAVAREFPVVTVLTPQ